MAETNPLLLDGGVNPIHSLPDAIQKEEDANAPGPSLSEGFGAAVDTTWIDSALETDVYGQKYAPDLNFSWVDHKGEWDSLTKTLTDEQKQDVARAASLEHAKYLAAQNHQFNEKADLLGRMGWTGVGLQFGAGIVDPAALLITFASDGVMGPAVFAKKASRLKRAIQTGLSGAGGNMAVESVIAANSPNEDWKDVLMAGASGYVLGHGLGYVGAAAHDNFATSVDALRRGMEYDEIRKAGGTINPNAPDPKMPEMDRDELLANDPFFTNTKTTSKLKEFDIDPSVDTTTLSLEDKATFDILNGIKTHDSELYHDVLKMAAAGGNTFSRFMSRVSDMQQKMGLGFDYDAVEGAIFKAGASAHGVNTKDELLATVKQQLIDNYTPTKRADAQQSIRMVEISKIEAKYMKTAKPLFKKLRQLEAKVERLNAKVARAAQKKLPRTDLKASITTLEAERAAARKELDDLDKGMTTELDEYQKTVMPDSIDLDEAQKINVWNPFTDNYTSLRDLESWFQAASSPNWIVDLSARTNHKTAGYKQGASGQNLDLYDQNIVKMMVAKDILDANPRVRGKSQSKIAAFKDLDTTFKKMVPTPGMRRKILDSVHEILRKVNSGEGVPAKIREDASRDNGGVANWKAGDESNQIGIGSVWSEGYKNPLDTFIHEIGHWAYGAILTPAQQLEYMILARKYFDPNTKLLDESMVEKRLTGREVPGVPSEWNGYWTPQEMFAHQTVLYAAKMELAPGIVKILQSVTKFVERLLGRYKEVDAVDPDFEKFFERIFRQKEELDDIPTKKSFDMTGSSVGAAQNMIYDLPYSDRVTAALQKAGAPIKSWGARYRFDMVARLKNSTNPIISRLGGLMGEEAVANVDNSAVVESASSKIRRDYKARMAKVVRSSEQPFKNWASRDGRKLNVWNRDQMREDFFQEVGRAIRRDAGTFSQDADINSVADMMREQYRELLAFAKEKKIPGFTDVDENENYMTRLHNIKKLDDLTRKYKPQQVYALVAESLKAGTAKGGTILDDDNAMKIARYYVKSIQERAWETDVQIARGFSTDQAEKLREILQDQGDLADGEIEEIVAMITNKAGDGTHVARAKHRLSLDEQFTMNLYNQQTGQHESVGIEDFLENNAMALMERYSRNITGLGHMQDVLGVFSKDIFDDLGNQIDAVIPTWENMKRIIQMSASQMGEMDMGTYKDELNKLEVLYKANVGIPLSKDNRTGRVLRMVRDYNFIRVMGQVGFAQIAEVGNMLGSFGIRAAMMHIPALKGIYKRAANGKLDDDLLDEIETVWGLGTDRLLGRDYYRFDDYDIMPNGTRKIDAALDKGKRFVADASFMAPINMALQRMAGRAAIQRFVNMAYGGRKISAKKLAALGMDQSMADRVFDQIRSHASVEEGMLGRKVKRSNVDGWADQEAAAAFVYTIDRWSRRVIQENDIGNMAEWMTTDMGKTLIQFRSFMAVSYTKQFMAGVQSFDFDTFAAWSLSTLFGGLSYIAQTSINSVGRDDQQEFLDERLSMNAIGAAAFQRAGYSSVFPGAIDTSMSLVGFDPVFAYGRTTGLASGFLTGNPTVSTLDSGTKAIRGLVAPMGSDYDYSKKDLAAQFTLLPFSNMLGIKQMYNVLGAELPDTSRDN